MLRNPLGQAGPCEAYTDYIKGVIDDNTEATKAATLPPPLPDGALPQDDTPLSNGPHIPQDDTPLSDGPPIPQDDTPPLDGPPLPNDALPLLTPSPSARNEEYICTVEKDQYSYISILIY